jgi:hypothetical protein
MKEIFTLRFFSVVQVGNFSQWKLYFQNQSNKLPVKFSLTLDGSATFTINICLYGMDFWRIRWASCWWDNWKAGDLHEETFLKVSSDGYSGNALNGAFFGVFSNVENYLWFCSSIVSTFVLWRWCCVLEIAGGGWTKNA